MGKDFILIEFGLRDRCNNTMKEPCFLWMYVTSMDIYSPWRACNICLNGSVVNLAVGSSQIAGRRWGSTKGCSSEA